MALLAWQRETNDEELSMRIRHDIRNCYVGESLGRSYLDLTWGRVVTEKPKASSSPEQGRVYERACQILNRLAAKEVLAAGYVARWRPHVFR